jgi:hypothetical protein
MRHPGDHSAEPGTNTVGFLGGSNTAHGEEFINKLIIPAVLVATGIATCAWSQAATPQLQNNRHFTMPLEKDPTREVGLQSVTVPPSAGNQFHRHPGEQWTAVQEGEITFHRQGAAAESGQGRRLELCSARDHPADPLHT